MKRVIAAAVLALLVASPAAAAKPPSGALSLGPSDLVYGGTVSLAVTTGATNSEVSFTCSQDGVPVAVGGGLVYHVASYVDGPFTLSSYTWTGGAASCVATLYSFTTSDHFRVMATLTFEVAG